MLGGQQGGEETKDHPPVELQEEPMEENQPPAPGNVISTLFAILANFNHFTHSTVWCPLVVLTLAL